MLSKIVSSLKSDISSQFITFVLSFLEI